MLELENLKPGDKRYLIKMDGEMYSFYYHENAISLMEEGVAEAVVSVTIDKVERVDQAELTRISEYFQFKFIFNQTLYFASVVKEEEEEIPAICSIEDSTRVYCPPYPEGMKEKAISEFQLSYCQKYRR